MKVVSMVPSWTETLLAAGVNVVGRTRFCIHPEKIVDSIPVVGGTKDWNWEKIEALNPDLILLDQEENPKFMSVQNAIPWHATHVQSLIDMPGCLQELSLRLKNMELASLAGRWSKVAVKTIEIPSIAQLPGIIEWGKHPETLVKNIIYMIWKDPWMCVSRDTFIGSMLQAYGVSVNLYNEKYPQINIEDYDPKDTLILFSSEPYPFLKKKPEMQTLLFPHAFVDGESFSWFGVRSLIFLESHS